MYPPGCAKVKCSWHHCLPGLLLQLLLALCFFSYLRMSQEKHKPKPMWVSELGAPSQATEGSSAHLPLRVLLWTWPFNQPVALSRCSELWPGTADCQLTVNRSEYPQVDAVLVHHREFSHRPQMQLPPSPRPPGQRWVWFSMESPSNCLKLKDLDGYFNLTMSYRRDSDIFMPYGWLEPWPSQPVETLLNISAKTKLVAWVVSNWNTDSIRVTKSFFSQLVPDSQADPHAPTCARGSGLCSSSGSSGFPCGLPGWFSCKESTCDAGDLSSVPGLARSPGKGNGNPVKHASMLSVGFSRQEYWSGLSFPLPGGLPDPGTKPRSPVSPVLQVDSSCKFFL